MAEITPPIPQGRQLIQGYGGGGFRIAGVAHRGSVLVFPETTLSWPVAALGLISTDSFGQVLGATPAPEILLIGCGPEFVVLAPAIGRMLEEAGIGVDVMDTGAACRTFNVLLAEDRAVAAALIALE